MFGHGQSKPDAQDVVPNPPNGTVSLRLAVAGEFFAYGRGANPDLAKKRKNKMVILLLAMILCVLLFGADQVLYVFKVGGPIVWEWIEVIAFFALFCFAVALGITLVRWPFFIVKEAWARWRSPKESRQNESLWLTAFLRACEWAE
jgi:hypothetical protein